MAGGEYEITNTTSTTFTISGLSNSSSNFYIWYKDGEWVGNVEMDPLEKMKQEFEALANLFFQENYDVNFVGFPTPPDYLLDNLMQ